MARFPACSGVASWARTPAGSAIRARCGHRGRVWVPVTATHWSVRIAARQGPSPCPYWPWLTTRTLRVGVRGGERFPGEP